MQFEGVANEKTGDVYMDVNRLRLKVEPESMHFDFSNLFNGDKELGDNMNLFLNENWSEIFGELRGSIATAFAQIFKSITETVFKKYPYAKMFA